MSSHPIRHPRSRFHVTCEACHFIAAHSTRQEARAEANAHHHGPTVEVFDSMARHGGVQLWRLSPMGNLDGVERRS